MAVTIIKEKCKGCSICVKNCPFGALTLENKLAVVGSSCTNCGVCVEKCPFGAIEKPEEAEEKRDPEPEKDGETYPDIEMDEGIIEKMDKASEPYFRREK